MDSHEFERLDTRFDRVEIRLDSVDNQLHAHTIQLTEHMRRTEAAEARLELHQMEFEPLKRHVAMWAGAGKVLTALGILATIATFLVKFWHR